MRNPLQFLVKVTTAAALFLGLAFGGEWQGKGISAQNNDRKWRLWTEGVKLRGANIWLTHVKNNRAVSVTPRYIRDDFRKLRELGANYVNISHPGIYDEKEDDGDYQRNENLVKSLEDLVDACQQEHLFVVISIRTGPKRNEKKVFVDDDESPLWKDSRAQTAWGRMWRDIALKFKEKPNVVGYDLMVEPETSNGEKWNRLAANLVLAIRSENGAGDKKTPILIGAPDMSGASYLEKLDLNIIDPNRDQKIVYTVHQYEPYSYAQQSEGAMTYDCDTGEIDLEKEKLNYRPYRGSNNEGMLLEQYRKIKEWRDRNNVPVAVNEFGVIRWAGSATDPDGEEFLEHEFEQLEAKGLNYAIWKWDPATCLGDNDYNFRHGQNINGQSDVPNLLVDVIHRYFTTNPDPVRP
jgi:aryl-phospho-beta-D-glucosidase BglC (GH1 family)